MSNPFEKPPMPTPEKPPEKPKEEIETTDLITKDKELRAEYFQIREKAKEINKKLEPIVENLDEKSENLYSKIMDIPVKKKKKWSDEQWDKKIENNKKLLEEIEVKLNETKDIDPNVKNYLIERIKQKQEEMLKAEVPPKGEVLLEKELKVVEKEKPEEEKTPEQIKEVSERTASNLSPENQDSFNSMSEDGQRIANQVYEGFDKMLVGDRIVGKLEIAYKQFWIDRHQEKAVQLKEKMDGLDLQISEFDTVKKEIESTIKGLKQENLPGVESLQLKLQDIDRQKIGLLNKRDRIQSKLEANDNKLKLYTNERDRVADKFIRHYEGKFKPMEAELERLQTCRDELDLTIAVAEAKHQEELDRLDGIEKKKIQIEEALHRAGMSERKVRKFEAIKQLEGVLEDGREKVKTEKENFARRKAEAEIDKKIAKVDAKANSYRDKREAFARLKEGRPIKIDVAARQRGEVFTGEEEVRAHRRAEVDYAEKPITAEFKREVEEAEKVEKAPDKERLQTSAFLADWNAFVKETYKDVAKFVDAKDFLRATGLSADYRLDSKNFKNILGKYLKFRKLPMEQFKRSIDAFLRKK